MTTFAEWSVSCLAGCLPFDRVCATEERLLLAWVPAVWFVLLEGARRLLAVAAAAGTLPLWKPIRAVLVVRVLSGADALLST